MEICILLATYNGEAFLKEQFDSLIHQTEKNWCCLIRDDGSTDNTLRVIKDYCELDTRFKLIVDDDGPQGNAKDNFSRLMSVALKTDSEYFFFCDQDDVWMDNKVEVLFLELNKHDINKPCLIHHDLEVVNENLTQISPSFFQFRRLDADVKFARLLSRNTVTGCASACNRKLIETCLPIPTEAIMHDWWLALVASYAGELRFIDQVLIKYRQHDNNVIGAKPFNVKIPLFISQKKFKKGLLRYHRTILQARAFLLLINANKNLPKTYLAAVKMYCQLLSLTKFQRIKAVLRFGFFQKHWRTKVTSFIKFILYSSKYHDV